MGFTSQTPFSNLAQIMGHIFVLGEGRKLVKAVFMIGIAGSLRAGTPFRGIARSHASNTRKERRMRGASRLARAFTCGKWRAFSRWLYCRLAANSIQST